MNQFNHNVKSATFRYKKNGNKYIKTIKNPTKEILAEWQKSTGVEWRDIVCVRIATEVASKMEKKK